ncbi:jg25768, partial [Pararge aegeria aegeria]
AITAKANGEPCCDWVGEDGAGHFVKMVHNGIEYGDMQLICEAYHLMKDVLVTLRPVRKSDSTEKPYNGPVMRIKLLLLKPMGSRAAIGSEKTALATSSRWCTTVLSTETCS